MKRKTLLTVLACGLGLAGIAAVDTYQRQDTDKGIRYSEENALKANPYREVKSPNRAPEYNWEGTDTVAYFVLGNNFQGDDYMFHLEGGKVDTYKLGICRNGNEVTITGLCNAYDPSSTWNQCHELPVKGTFDEAAGTITVPVNVRGGYSDYYEYELAAAEFDDRGNVARELDEIVFSVDPEFKTLSTETSFGLKYTYGWGVRYKSMSAVKVDPETPADLRAVVESIDFGTQYAGGRTEKTWTVTNMGGQDAEYVISIDSDEDSFTCTTMSGVIPAYTMMDFTFVFQPQSVGEFEGLATIETEDCEPILVQFAGEAVETPDYSAIVKNGDFTFETNIEFPFEIAEMENPENEGETLTVARSGTKGKYGISTLKAKFTVPEGKIGKLSFKDYFINTGGMAGWYKVQSSICYDSETTATAQTNYTGFFADDVCTREFKAGDHFVYFYHNNNAFTGEDTDGTYVWDLDLELSDVITDEAELITPSVDLGNLLYEAGTPCSKEGNIVLVNKGANPLKVNAVSSDNSEFTAQVPPASVGTLQELVVPVTVKPESSGKKTANITVETTAGTFTAEVSCNVIDNPDIMSIVTGNKELVTVENDPEFPFLIENGAAYNCTHGTAYNGAVTSSVKIKVNVPEGKTAKVSFRAHHWGTPAADYYTSDYVQQNGGVRVSLSTGNSYSGGCYDNDVDYSSDNIVASADFLAQYFNLPDGESTYEFYYTKTGYNEEVEQDRLEVYEFNVEVVDAVADRAELVTETPLDFGSIYVGPQRWVRKTVTIRNTGSNDLYILDSPAVGPFSVNVPADQRGVKYLGTIDLYAWYYPTEEGEYEEDLVIKTSGGDIVVPCKGSTKSVEGILYPGDFEDAAYGWRIYDADGDGETWNLGSNLWGENANYCHTGTECIASISMSNDYGSITPDNWTVSPNLTIPEEGAKLTYYISPFHPTRFYENYSLYIVEAEEDFREAEPVISETFTEAAVQDPETRYVNGWVYREVDLTPYAGKTINICFRHHDCTGQYLIRLDDMFVYTDPTAVKGIEAGNEAYGILRQEVYDVNGNRLGELQNGVNIVRTFYKNGKSATSKVMYRK